MIHDIERRYARQDDRARKARVTGKSIRQGARKDHR